MKQDHGIVIVVMVLLLFGFFAAGTLFGVLIAPSSSVSGSEGFYNTSTVANSYIIANNRSCSIILDYDGQFSTTYVDDELTNTYTCQYLPRDKIVRAVIFNKYDNNIVVCEGRVE